MFPATYNNGMGGYPVNQYGGQQYGNQTIQNVPPQNVNPQMPQTMPAQMQQSAPPLMVQSGGFIRVHGEDEVRQWNVRPGEKLNFVTDDVSHFYTKYLGFSPFDMPVIERYRVIKEDDVPPQQPHTESAAQTTPQIDTSGFVNRTELDDLKLEIEVLKEQLANMRGGNNEK